MFMSKPTTIEFKLSSTDFSKGKYGLINKKNIKNVSLDLLIILSFINHPQIHLYEKKFIEENRYLNTDDQKYLSNYLKNKGENLKGINKSEKIFVNYLVKNRQLDLENKIYAQ